MWETVSSTGLFLDVLIIYSVSLPLNHLLLSEAILMQLTFNVTVIQRLSLSFSLSFPRGMIASWTRLHVTKVNSIYIC